MLKDIEDDDFSIENRTMSKYRFFVFDLMRITIIVQCIWGAIYEEASYASPNWIRKPITFLPVWNCVTSTFLTIPAYRMTNKYGTKASNIIIYYHRSIEIEPVMFLLF